MLGNIFEFKGNSISIEEPNFKIGLKLCTWYGDLETSDSQENIQGNHGVRVSPTFARTRLIEIEGEIVAYTRADSQEGIDYLSNLFALEGVPNNIGLYDFTAEDEKNRRWTLKAKVKTPLLLDIDEEDQTNPYFRRFRVVLQAPDPRYFSSIENIINGTESHFGGFKLGVKLGAKMDQYFNTLLVSPSGNITSPLIVTLNVKGPVQSPLTVKNLTNGSFASFDITASNGDIIIIDSLNRTATKNGVDILANRLPGSTWLEAKGDNILSVYDKEGGLFESDFDIQVKYRDVLL